MNPNLLALALLNRSSVLIAFAAAGLAQNSWDLGGDWSDSQNPNGVWSYNAGSLPIANHVSPWGGNQDGWAAASVPNFGHIPVWGRATNPGIAESPAVDCPVGTVFCHSNSFNSGNDTDISNVTWTCPLACAVTVDFATWFATPGAPEQNSRQNAWRVYHDGTLLASGVVGDNDPYDSTNPATFSASLAVNPGDVIRAEFERYQTEGTFSAVRLTITPVIHADAGPDQSLPETTLVTLDGSGSFLPLGTPSYVWTQVAGTPVMLDLTDPARPRFVAPFVPLGGETLTFQLVVSDGVQFSEPDVVNVTVSNVNHPPVALAGDDQVVAEASPVQLDGSNSFDQDDDSLSYGWDQIAGTPMVLDLSDPVRPTFTAPLVGTLGETLLFELTVDDGQACSTDLVAVSVENVNHAPIADAGPDQTRNEGSLVELDASASLDPDGDALTFDWLQTAGPAMVLSTPGSVMATFTAPPVGAGGILLTFRVTVDDGYGGSEFDDVSITIQDANAAPACDLARPSVVELWPPNHKLVAVSILGVTDPENNAITITVLDITQDEPIDGTGDGDTSPDGVIQGGTALLRAERDGGRNGRVYRVTFLADDGLGGVCTGQVSVCVPRSKTKNGPPSIDDGQFYSSL